MDKIQTDAYEIINSIYTYGVKPLIVEKEDYAYIRDPVFDVKRNRIIAETLKTIIRLESNLEKDEKIILKLYGHLEKNQNNDGSWNEIHPDYNQPSALITSIIGEALLLFHEKFPNKNLEESVHLARDYVLSQEKSPGYFLKSVQYTADHLNVDATCGAFLALYGKIFSDEHCIKIAKQSAKHICDHQFLDGSYPYTINKGNYPYLLNIPCIHYQAVTLYYLSKIHAVIKEKWLEENLKKGTEWLFAAQKNNGQFDWSKSGLMLTYYLVGAYAFAFSSFVYASKWNEKYFEKAKLCLNVIKENTKELCLRWEKNSWTTFPLSISLTFRTALIGDYPLKHRLERFGFGLFRQIARRRIATQTDVKLYTILANILNVKTLSRESFKNYPDMFMTSEVLDCLSSSQLFLSGDVYTI